MNILLQTRKRRKKAPRIYTTRPAFNMVRNKGLPIKENQTLTPKLQILRNPRPPIALYSSFQCSPHSHYRGADGALGI